MTDDRFKRYQEAGNDFLETARARAEDFLRELAKATESTQKQAQEQVDEIVAAGRRGTDQMIDLIRREVESQLSQIGVVTKAEFEAWKRRLSGGSAAKAPAGKTPATEAAAGSRAAPATKKATGTKSPATKSTTKKSTTKKSTTKKSAPSKSAGTKSAGTKSAPSKSGATKSAPSKSAAPKSAGKKAPAKKAPANKATGSSSAT